MADVPMLATAPRGDVVAWRGRVLASRCLSADELRDHYLPLRYDVLHSELHWTIGDVHGPLGLHDAHDRVSIAHGVFADGDGLIAAARLILPADARALPSMRLLSTHRHRPRFPGPVAEISRVIVRPECRKLGLFRVLLMSSLRLAQAAAVRSLLITERDDARLARSMANSGFARYADGFSFADETIAPQEPAATYVLDVQTNLDEAMLAAIAVQLETLLRAAEGLLTARRQSSRPPQVLADSSND
jgi:predicted GNAT family N-acyltransferase